MKNPLQIGKYIFNNVLLGDNDEINHFLAFQKENCPHFNEIFDDAAKREFSRAIMETVAKSIMNDDRIPDRILIGAWDRQGHLLGMLYAYSSEIARNSCSRQEVTIDWLTVYPEPINSEIAVGLIKGLIQYCRSFNEEHLSPFVCCTIDKGDVGGAELLGLAGFKHLVDGEQTSGTHLYAFQQE